MQSATLVSRSVKMWVKRPGALVLQGIHSVFVIKDPAKVKSVK